MKFTPDSPARRTLLAGALVAVIVLGVAMAYQGLTRSPDENRSAAMICDKCGHRFEVSARSYHAAGGQAARCPKCLQGAGDPLLAVCPHCSRPVRYGDIPQGSEVHTRRLCPFCRKAMP